MKSVNIRLTMMTDHVKNFVSLVNRYPYDMDLRSGRYVVDAKSILGIFPLICLVRSAWISTATNAMIC